jgi:hypothetical protein
LGLGPGIKPVAFALKRDFAQKPRRMPEKLRLKVTSYLFVESGFRSLEWGRFQPRPAMGVIKHLITLAVLSVCFRVK